MNELQLSKDLNVITAEINSYKQVAGQAVFEIGRRLKHVKENDLVHGEWEEWLKTIDMTRQHAHRFIKVYEEFGESNVTPMLHLGINALYQIATLPPEEREKEHKLDSGETKTVDEMTVRELQEVKRKLREEEQAKQQAEQQAERRERERLEEENEKLANQEPKVIEKEVVKEIDKTDYERINKLNEEIELLNEQIRKSKEESERLQEQLKKQQERTKEYNKLKSELDETTEKLLALSKEQTRKVNRRTILDHASYMSRDVGAWVRRIKHYILERDADMQGDPDVNRAINAMINTLEETLAEVRSWQEVKKSNNETTNTSDDVLDVDFEEIVQ